MHVVLVYQCNGTVNKTGHGKHKWKKEKKKEERNNEQSFFSTGVKNCVVTVTNMQWVLTCVCEAMTSVHFISAALYLLYECYSFINLLPPVIHLWLDHDDVPFTSEEHPKQRHSAPVHVGMKTALSQINDVALNTLGLQVEQVGLVEWRVWVNYSCQEWQYCPGKKMPHFSNTWTALSVKF